MIEYQEQVLNMFALCPLRTESVNRDPLYGAACELLSWAVKRTFEGAVPELKQLRERYCVVWKSLYYPAYKDTPVPPNHPTYWEGPRKAGLIGRKIFDFCTRFEVLHPEQYYTVTLGSQLVKGSYTLVRRRMAGSFPMVLVTHPNAPLHKYPDLKSLARWLDARRSLTDREIGVYHFPLVRGDAWSLNNVDERLVLQWLGSILDSVSKTRYPSPGSHCATCIRHDCMEVLNGPNDYRR